MRASKEQKTMKKRKKSKLMGDALSIGGANKSLDNWKVNLLSAFRPRGGSSIYRDIVYITSKFS